MNYSPDQTGNAYKQSDTYTEAYFALKKEDGSVIVYQPGSFDSTSAPLSSIAPVKAKESGLMSERLGRIEFWLGITATLVAILVATCGAVWTISNSINDKINQSRQEVNLSVQTSKAEITSRIDRLEDKVDTGFKDTTSSLNDLKVILLTQKSPSTKD